MMKGLFGNLKTSVHAKNSGGNDEAVHQNLRKKTFSDVESAAGHCGIPRAGSRKETISSRPSSTKVVPEGLRTPGISFPGGSSVSYRFPVAEDDICGLSTSSGRRAERGFASSSSRIQLQHALSKRLSLHGRDSLSSTSLKRTEFSLSQTIVVTDNHPWLSQAWWFIRNILFYTGRLGVKVNPFTLAFVDKDIERDWLARKARRGARSLLWLGAFFFVQTCFELTDRVIAGVPLNTLDGKLMMLPTFLTLPLPIALLILALTPCGRAHSTSFLTAAFFLYGPFFLLYSTRMRLREISEFFLGRPLAFDVSLFVTRDSIITTSQPLLLVIAAYTVGLSFIWSTLFCFWVAIWWTVVHSLMPLDDRMLTSWDWFILIMSPIFFLSITCFTARTGTIASRHRFSMMKQAERDLKGIREQTAILVEHSALADLYNRIASAESFLRQVKLDYPKNAGRLESVISRVVVYLIQAQICLSHLDDQKTAETLNASTNAWAVRRSAGLENSMEGRDVLSKKEAKEIIEFTKTYLQKHFYEPDGNNAPEPEAHQIEEELTSGKFRIRSGDRLLLGHRASLGKVQADATIDLRRRISCNNFIKDLIERLQRLPPSSHKEEPATSGVSPQRGNRFSPEKKKVFNKASIKEVISNPYPDEQLDIGAPPDPIMSLLVQVGRVWNLDVFLLSELTNGNVLPSVGFELRRAFLNADDAIPVDDSKWSTFMREISVRYQKTSYHNERHGGTVAHLNVWLLRNTACWNPLTPCQKLAVVVAALVHDVGHFGVNNALLVNSSHPLSVTYNDRAVLENFHSSVAFRTMLFYSNGAANILEQLTHDQYKAERAAIIELVLETDMASHFDFLTRFQLKMHLIKATVVRLSNAESAEDELDGRVLLEDALADCWMVAKACIRCADIGHSAVRWEFHYNWSCLLMEEFFAQGRQEEALGLPVSPVCDEANTDVAQSQMGFIKFICQPLFEALDNADPSGSVITVCLRQMRSNSATWQRIADAGIDWKNKEEVAKESCQLVSLISSSVS